MTAFELTSSLGALLIVFLVQTIVVAGLLWCAMKLLKRKRSAMALISSSAAASLIGFVPFAGPALSFIALIFLISWFNKISKLGAVVIVTLAWGIGIAATVGLLMLLDFVSVKI